MNSSLKVGVCTAALAVATAAHAHVVVQPATALPGAEETLTFVVGHGCNGQPTTALRVELPPGVKLLMPDTKPDWTLDTERTAGGGRALTWRGELPARQAEGFKAHVRLPSTPGPLAFAVTQTCGTVTVQWNEPTPAGGPKPQHPAPTLTLTAGEAGAAEAAGESPPAGLQRRADGGLSDAAGLPLYTFDGDIMVGMSHCEGDCARIWPPVLAPREAKAFGPWSLVVRADGAEQWAFRTKPLYTYSRDRPGQPPSGAKAPNWKLAR
jgi:predicted lipoprotein with Yx(FWY)xxD motif